MPTWMCFMYEEFGGRRERQAAQQLPCSHAPVTMRTNCCVNKKQNVFRFAGSMDTFNFLQAHLGSVPAIACAIQRGTNQGTPPDGCKSPCYSLGEPCRLVAASAALECSLL